MALQQSRIIRFLMVIGIVVLTIFIYASYYSNPAMTIPTRIHSTAALVSAINSNSHSNSINNKSDDKGGGGDVSEDKGNIVSQIYSENYSNNLSELKLHHINNNLVVDKENSYKLKQNKIERDSNISKFPQYSDSSLPSLNMQNIVRNADKILKNLTISKAVTTINSTIQQQQKDKSSQSSMPNQKQQNNLKDSLLPQSPSSTAIRISLQSSSSKPESSNGIIINNNQTSANTTIQQLDPSNGIPTGQLYESGHLDVNPHLCPDEGDQLRLLIIITSAPTHREARLAIRQTWGHYGVRRDVAIAFILGRTTNQAVEDSLSAENYMYGDLVRGHFIDSYNNLTLKTISVLEWVDKQCPHASYVLKTDDDMFINVPKLLAFIEKQHQKHEKRIIYGRLAKKWKPIRNKKSKYYVAPGQFSQTVFPQFTTGPAYLMSSDIIHDLFIKSLEQTYLKLEDVFTTGIVAQLLGIKRVHVNEFLNRRIAFNPCNIRKAISVHMIKSNEQFDLWKKLLDTSTKCK